MHYTYGIYLIKYPGRLLNFGYWEWALIQGGCLFEAGPLLNLHHFQQVASLFCNKIINNNKTWRCTQADF